MPVTQAGLRPFPSALFVDRGAAGPSQEAIVQDLQQVARDIVSGNDPELALDILLNLAAGRAGEAPSQAQAILRDLYEDPAQYASGLTAHGKQEVRSRLHAGALLALRKPQFFKDPSPTVVYVAGRTEAHGADAHKSEALAILEAQICAPGKNRSIEAGDNVLHGNRFINASELLAARTALPDVHLHRMPLSLCMNLRTRGEMTRGEQELASAEFENVFEEVYQAIAAAPAGTCHTALVNTGYGSNDHWLPLILSKDAGDNLHCHVLDSDAPSSKSAPSCEMLEALVEACIQRVEPGEAPKSPVEMHIFREDMQGNAPNGCGALAHRLFKHLQAALSANPALGLDAAGISAFIERYVKDWNSVDAADQHAAMLAVRAELLSAWAR